VDLLPNSWFYDSVDVTGDATNLTVCVSGNTAPIDIYISREGPPTQTSFDYHLRVNPPGGCLPITIFDQPPLVAGRYYVGIYNGNFSVQHIRVTAELFKNPFAIASSVSGAGGPVSILDDAITYAYLTNLTHLPISSLDVGLLISDPRISDLAITLISPNGTRVLLFEDRGANSTSGLGTFGSSFSSTDMAPFYTNNFDDVPVGNYSPGSSFDGWHILQDQVTVFPELPAPWLSNNVVILNDGIISNTLPTTNSTQYSLSFEATHAPYLVGTVAWWPFDNDGSDIVSGFDATLLGDVAFNPAKVNQGFTGDGLATRVMVERAPALDVGQNNGFTIEGWINPHVIPGGVADDVLMSDGFEFATNGIYSFGSSPSGWLVLTGQVDVLSAGVLTNFAIPDSGKNCLQLNGSVPGAISRDINTTPGLNYLLSFAYTKSPNSGDPAFVANATLSITGNPDVPVSYGQANSVTNPAWMHTGVLFTASSQVTTVTFTSLNPGSNGLYLDTLKAVRINTNIYPTPLVEWDDPLTPAYQGVQFFLSGASARTGSSFLGANLWDTNSQTHVITALSLLVTNDGWQHVALSFDRSNYTARLYVNGVLASSQTVATTNFVPLTSGDLYFGYHPATAPNFVSLNGGLDEFGLYNRQLSDCEIAAIAKAGSLGKYGTNVLTCPISGNIQVLSAFGTINAAITGGTNVISFTTPAPGPVPNPTPIIVTSLDPNLTVDNFVLSELVTNYVNGLMHFTENTNVALVPIKFAPAPYSVANSAPTLIFSNDFETALPGLYNTNSIVPGSANLPAVGVRNWTVVNGPVTVLSNTLVSAIGANSVALGSGGLQCALPTTPGNRYSLTYSVRGPGMVGWWNGDVEPLSQRAWDLIGGNHGAFINGATNSLDGFVNVRGDTTALFLPGVIDQTNNGISKIELGDPPNLRLTNSFTIEGWIKPVQVTSFVPEQTEQIFFRGDRLQCTEPYYFGVERVTANQLDLIFHINDDKGRDCGIILESANQPILADQWQHVAAVFEANTFWATNAAYPTNELRLYVNGQQLVPQNNEAFMEDPSQVNFVNSGFTGRFPYADLDPALSPGVSIGNRSRYDYSEPFHGYIDELSVYGRALTGPEIAAIAAAGFNGKADAVMPPAQGLAKLAVLVNNVQLAVGYGDNAGWTAHTVEFTADQTNLVLTLQSLLPGTIVDGISLTELPAELNYLPETSLAALNGEDAYGVWTLEMWDTRTGANSTPNSASLLDWQLNFVLQPSNPPPVIHLQHGIIYTNTIVAGGTQNLVVDVPLWASNATNMLVAATDRSLTVPLPVGVLWDLFNPAPNSLANTIVWPPNNTGSLLLTAPPDIIPGQPYYLSITNPNPVSVTFAYGVWFDVPTLTNCAPYSNYVAQAGIPRYLQFNVPNNAVPPQAVSFYLTGVSNSVTGIGSNVTIVVSEHLPLPDLTHYDYISTNPSTNDDIVMVVTNTTPFPIQTNTWYVGIFSQADNNVPFIAQACVNTNYPTIIPLSNNVPFVAFVTNAFAAPPGPPRQFFFEFQVSGAANAMLFELYGLSGDLDLVVQKDIPPTMAPYSDGSFQAPSFYRYHSIFSGTNWEQIVLRTSSEMPSLQGNWYVGLYNNEDKNVAYTLRAVTSSGGNALLSIQEPPAPSYIAIPGGQGVLVSWYSIPGEYYQVQSSRADFINWVTVPGGLVRATTAETTLLISAPSGTLTIYRIVHVSQNNLGQTSLLIRLWINNQVRISWPAGFPNSVLQYSTSPFGPWFNANLAVSIIGAEAVVFDGIRSTPRYYRLRQ
jgi:subtilisin-like proprotein convertase family protein